MTQCTARAFVFSGRPDPTWVVEKQRSRKLYSIWKQLKPSVPPTPAQPRLGYRGVSMACGRRGEFIAFAGYVRNTIGDTVEWKKDEEGVFERFLLSTAPENCIPAGIIDT
jgi:hypothetical protein